MPQWGFMSRADARPCHHDQLTRSSLRVPDAAARWADRLMSAFHPFRTFERWGTLAHIDEQRHQCDG
jgi:hypothetical protein